MLKKIYAVLLSAFLMSALILSGCSAKDGQVMATTGDTVKVHYTGTLSDGTVFDSSEGRDPLEFTIGEGSMIEGFDKTVNGMKVGETKTVTLPADQAYGPYHEELVLDIPRNQIPEGMNPVVGDHLQMRDASGGVTIVTVTKADAEGIRVDANHELAGKDLTFKITLVEIANK